MRDIEFRGISDVTKEFVYGTVVYGKSFTFIVPIGKIAKQEDYNFVYADTIGQYTGLKDKNGVKIYEGDILQYTVIHDSGIPSSLAIDPPESEIFSYEVEWHDGSFWCNGYLLSMCVNESEHCEIVGNIFDSEL